VRVEILDGVSEVTPSQWDALVGADDPFVEWGFLSSLEASGSVGPTTGWEPVPVTLWHQDTLIGAVPAYLKSHSFGEYIFDFGWAQLSQQLGIPYYPKVVVGIPFTPATGQRILIHQAPQTLGLTEEAIIRALLEGIEELTQIRQAGSTHGLFLTEQEQHWFADYGGFVCRRTHQFQWLSGGERDFPDLLDQFRARVRKEVRRERKQLEASGLSFSFVDGHEADSDLIELLESGYRDTCFRRGGQPYLKPGFFRLLATRHGHRMKILVAHKNQGAVATALFFQKGDVLYGRYWGSVEDIPFLHFEMTCYRPLEYAIATGKKRYEAGAQGHHKLRRGLLARSTLSAHRFRHPALQQVIGRYLPREEEETLAEITWLNQHGPYRQVQK